MTVHQLSRTEARQIAVRAQLLDANRPTDLLETVRQLTLLQDDRTAAVAPNAELVIWSRLGSSCPRTAVAEAVEEQALIDLHGVLRPAEDIALYRGEMADWPGVSEDPDWRESAAWVRANEDFRRDLIERAAARRPAAVARTARHLRRPVAFDGLEQQPQRRDDARDAGAAW